MGKSEGPENGREAKGVKEERESVRGRRKECGLGLEEGRVGRRDGSLIWLQIMVSRRV